MSGVREPARARTTKPTVQTLQRLEARARPSEASIVGGYWRHGNCWAPMLVGWIWMRSPRWSDRAREPEIEVLETGKNREVTEAAA